MIAFDITPEDAAVYGLRRIEDGPFAEYVRDRYSVGYRGLALWADSDSYDDLWESYLEYRRDTDTPPEDD